MLEFCSRVPRPFQMASHRGRPGRPPRAPQERPRPPPERSRGALRGAARAPSVRCHLKGPWYPAAELEHGVYFSYAKLRVQQQDIKTLIQFIVFEHDFLHSSFCLHRNIKLAKKPMTSATEIPVDILRCHFNGRHPAPPVLMPFESALDYVSYDR